jgi:hypothetical protein
VPPPQEERERGCSRYVGSVRGWRLLERAAPAGGTKRDTARTAGPDTSRALEQVRPLRRVGPRLALGGALSASSSRCTTSDAGGRPLAEQLRPLTLPENGRTAPGHALYRGRSLSPSHYPFSEHKNASALRGVTRATLKRGRRLALGEPVGPMRPHQQAGGDAIGHLSAQAPCRGDGGGGNAGQAPHVLGEPGALPVGVSAPPPAAHVAPSTG